MKKNNIREINEAVKKGEKDVAKLLGGQHAVLS